MLKTTYVLAIASSAKTELFLLGPRGTGKTAWLHSVLPKALRFDLLDARTYTELLSSPAVLGERIPQALADWVVIDEVQRVPEILNEVHRLIESRGLRFVLTGSSARKLRRRGTNLLAGRALSRTMHPLTALELGKDFNLQRALRYGCLPFACTTTEPRDYLASYVATYLREEVMQEGLARNIASFSRFLEAASFSQAAVLNMAAVARECSVHAKVVEDYFTILEDLLIAVRIPVFNRRAKRRLTAHRKFFYFDSGIYQSIRPRGPLDAEEEIQGPALETLLLQQLRAVNDYFGLGYTIHYWRTANDEEVDFVLYGGRGLLAFEVKRSARVQAEDLSALRLFRQDYPQSKAYLLYLGTRSWHQSGIEIMPLEQALQKLDQILS